MLKNKTVLITSGHQGGGAAVALRYANAGANVVILADQETKKIELPGGKSLTFSLNFSDISAIEKTIQKIISHFGGIDILINNFSQFHFKNSMETTAEDFNKVIKNIFATFFFSQACIPYLKKSENPHVINISPPLDMVSAKEACEHHLLFSISKYGMSFCTLGMAEEFRKFGIAFNSLWQKRPIATETLIRNFDNEVVKGSNRAEIYAEAAYLISLKPAKQFTGNYCIDEDIVREANIDLQQYAVDPSAPPIQDIFLPGVDYTILKSIIK